MQVKVGKNTWANVIKTIPCKLNNFTRINIQHIGHFIGQVGGQIKRNIIAIQGFIENF